MFNKHKPEKEREWMELRRKTKTFYLETLRPQILITLSFSVSISSFNKIIFKSKTLRHLELLNTVRFYVESFTGRTSHWLGQGL